MTGVLAWSLLPLLLGPQHSWVMAMQRAPLGHAATPEQSLQQGQAEASTSRKGED